MPPRARSAHPASLLSLFQNSSRICCSIPQTKRYIALNRMTATRFSVYLFSLARKGVLRSRYRNIRSARPDGMITDAAHLVVVRYASLHIFTSGTATVPV